ncbi:hypothetical protein DPMN_086121 [Dreissena polymorpha]|uniref:Uncharacterized protein n=1 Tax=Dreissena polymorpha TaxID=45954 RepID=A0A9D3YDJ3_DREPO|nr:hypothetical protein DPMN_086121 [Dreissena polymorpha]
MFLFYTFFQVAPMTRVDKAEIFDLTVFHLTAVQQQQRSVTMDTEAAAYSAGFKDCAREMTFFSAHKVTNSCAIQGLIDHIHIKRTPLVSSAGSRQMYTQIKVNDVTNMASYLSYAPTVSPITAHCVVVDRELRYFRIIIFF